MDGNRAGPPSLSSLPALRRSPYKRFHSNLATAPTCNTVGTYHITDNASRNRSAARLEPRHNHTSTQSQSLGSGAQRGGVLTSFTWPTVLAEGDLHPSQPTAPTVMGCGAFIIVHCKAVHQLVTHGHAGQRWPHSPSETCASHMPYSTRALSQYGLKPYGCRSCPPSRLVSGRKSAPRVHGTTPGHGGPCAAWLLVTKGLLKQREAHELHLRVRKVRKELRGAV